MLCFLFPDWDDNVTKRAKDYIPLYDKLIIVIPESGRTVIPIPGCEKVSDNYPRDSNGWDHDPSEISGDQVNLPIVCALKDAVGVKQYSVTHVYEINDKQINDDHTMEEMVRRREWCN